MLSVIKCIDVGMYLVCRLLGQTPHTIAHPLTNPPPGPQSARRKDNIVTLRQHFLLLPFCTPQPPPNTNNSPTFAPSLAAVGQNNFSTKSLFSISNRFHLLRPSLHAPLCESPRTHFLSALSHRGISTIPYPSTSNILNLRSLIPIPSEATLDFTTRAHHGRPRRGL